MQTDFNKETLLAGITPFIEAEVESHQRLTLGVWNDLPQIQATDSAAIQFIDCAFKYVTERSITFQETSLYPWSNNERPGKFEDWEIYPCFDEAKTNPEYKAEGPTLKDAIVGMHDLVMRNLCTDIKKPITDSPEVRSFICFTFTAYLHYCLDFEEIGMFHRENDSAPGPFGNRLFTYEELAFIAGVKRSSIDTKIKNEELTPTNENNMVAYGNNLINEAVGCDLIPGKRKNAFVDIYQSMSYLMSAQRTKYRPTKLMFEYDGRNLFPQYWENDYFVKHIAPWLGRESEEWISFRDWIQFSEPHWTKIKQGKAGLTFCQARMADLYIHLSYDVDDYPEYLFAAHIKNLNLNA